MLTGFDCARYCTEQASIEAAFVTCEHVEGYSAYVAQAFCAGVAIVRRRLPPVRFHFSLRVEVCGLDLRFSSRRLSIAPTRKFKGSSMNRTIANVLFTSAGILTGFAAEKLTAGTFNLTDLNSTVAITPSAIKRFDKLDHQRHEHRGKAVVLVCRGRWRAKLAGHAWSYQHEHVQRRQRHRRGRGCLFRRQRPERQGRLSLDRRLQQRRVRSAGNDKPYQHHDRVAIVPLLSVFGTTICPEAAATACSSPT